MPRQQPMQTCAEKSAFYIFDFAKVVTKANCLSILKFPFLLKYENRIIQTSPKITEGHCGRQITKKPLQFDTCLARDYISNAAASKYVR